MRRLAAILVAPAAVAPASAVARDRWDTRLLARVGHPGYPAHAYVHPNGRIYEGTYVNSESSEPSRILEYESDGTLLRSWTMQGQDLAAEHGVQVATSDAQGRLLLARPHAGARRAAGPPHGRPDHLRGVPARRRARRAGPHSVRLRPRRYGARD